MPQSQYLELVRFQSENDFTHGFLRINGKFECFTLEDEMRAVKIKGEKRIPEDFYKLAIRKELTPLTKRYRKRFPSWFKYHIEIIGIPDFDMVYVHIGNDDDDTGGCPLVGQTCDSTKSKNGWIGRSTQAFESFYKKIYPMLERGDDVKINIINIDKES